MIFFVYAAQILKYVYDTYANDQLEQITKVEDYYDIGDLFLFNNSCMFLDSVIIIMDALSLLKYTSLALPELETLIITFY